MNLSEIGPLKVSPLFEDSCLLITGATGFLGKVLLEKLLFSQPKIDKIFLLIRPLNKQTVKERLEALLESPLFNRIRCVDEKRLKKLVPINSDLRMEGIGLSEQDRTMLISQVTFVFHCAATVKFDEAIRLAIQMNVIGTQRLVALCHEMPHLKAFLHASSAYANCNLARTEERIYEQKVNVSKLVEATEWMSDEMFDAIEGQLLENRPNTYTFAKAMAENQLNKDAVGLPTIIARPSIIGAIWREPLPGWIDNMNGPTGIFASVGKGLLTDMIGDNKSTADIIPVDIVASMLIVAAAYRSQMGQCKEVPVFHCTTGQLNPLLWERIVIYSEQFFSAFPFDECYRIPSTKLSSNRNLLLAKFYVKHMSTAYAFDAAYRLLGKEEKFVRIYRKIWRMMEVLHYFTSRGWIFESDNALAMWENLSEEDKKLYCFDVRKLDWGNYLFDYLMGVKIYLLKESLDDVPKAQANILWQKQFNLYSNGLFFALLVRLFAWRRSKRQRWALWFGGFLLTYAYQNANQWLRPVVRLRSLEEYKRTALRYFSDNEQQKHLNNGRRRRTENSDHSK
uniref:Fatty acyl-CoA reductase n=1 Tax=Globodera rostochiensis TaxID=31243 RepID=A0A914I2E4_GLORO